MNPNTRVAVCCYAGDQHQVVQSLDLYLHHQCPVVALSPEDAPANIKHWAVTNLHTGKRGQYGPEAHARHLENLKLLLTFPEDRFLIHESDSICLDPKIPQYLYDTPDIVWSNPGEATPDHHPGFPEGCPKMSFQPPWFFSRKTIEAFVTVADTVKYHPNTEWVDLYLCLLTHAANIPWRPFDAAYLGPMSACYDDETGEHFDPGTEPGHTRKQPLSDYLIQAYALGLKNGLEYVSKGANMVHSVKSPIASHALAREYRRYLARTDL